MIIKCNEQNIIELNKMLKYFSSEINVNDFTDSPYSIYLAHLSNNELTGFINFNLLYERAELNYLYVKNDYRGLGLGKLLCQEMVNYCMKESVDSITLEVNQKNDTAVKLYKKIGFREISVRKNYYKDEDAYLMEKVIK